MHSSYPWHELPQLSAAHRDTVALRRAAQHAFDLKGAEQAAQELLVGDIELKLTRCAAGPAPTLEHRVVLRDQQRKQWLVVAAEVDLAVAAMTRLLARPLRMNTPTGRLDEALRGAQAALVLELTRRATRDKAYSLAIDAPAPGLHGLTAQCALLLGGRRYGLDLWLSQDPLGTPATPPVARGSYPPELKLTLPLVVAQATTALGELSGLQPGDIWLCGSGWSIDASGSGSAVLCAPEAQRGVSCNVSGTQIVLGSERVALSDQRWGMDGNDSNDPLDLTLAEVPVVVRVEMGQVTLPAAQWADLAPGDVLTLGKEVGGPVVLRAAGTVIAEGELVNVDGELGVRITRVGAPKGQ